jgi:hypothetical protein
METDKDLLRQGRYSEALGDNYERYCYHILLFKNNLCVEGNEFKHKEINKTYSAIRDAERCVKLMTKRNKLPCHMEYRIWNSNSDWL